jgi:flagellar basal body rod protein FlgG
MGPEALQRAARAFRYWEHRQEAVAHNLANASTPGFKGERVFARLLEGDGLEVRGHTDMSPGGLMETGRPLDLALKGQGFLVVETPGGERLVRGGSFRLDASRTLVDGHGNPLLAEYGSARGPITLPEGDLEITARGEVLVDKTPVATLRVVQLAEEGAVEREGGLYLRPLGDTVSPGEGEVEILPGRLEESNVEPVGSLVEMIEIQRAYSALQRSVLAMDGVLDRISNDLGKV